MKNKAKEGKWYSLFLYIPLFIISLPWIIVVLIKDSMAERKRKKERREKYHDIYDSHFMFYYLCEIFNEYSA